jgi:V/A-type H+-transporting ATPase subunit I
MDVGGVGAKLRHFEAQAKPYRELLPDCAFCPTGFEGSPERIAAHAIHTLRRWSVQVEEARAQHEALHSERAELELLGEAMDALGADAASLPEIGQPTAFLFKGLFACPPDLRPEPSTGAAPWNLYRGVNHHFVLVATLPEQAEDPQARLESMQCTRVRIPAWLRAARGDPRAALRARRAEVNDELGALDARIAALRADGGMTEALANVATLRWYLDNAPSLAAQQRLCHVTGWTTAARPEPLQTALNRAGIQAVVRFAEPPMATRAPVHSTRSGWARPFRFFVDMWGTPTGTEVDPSGLLPIIVPLLFGYMFPDVGHGLALMLIAAVLYRRLPAIRFLLPCGAMAAVFGFVFGEFFGLHGIIEPLWIRPLEEPLQVLLMPLSLGVLLMLLGLVFTGVEALWRGELRQWLWLDAAVLLIYASALAALLHPLALAGIALGLLWYLVGGLVLVRARKLPHIGVPLGHLAHSVFALLMNTASFLRVGAFALAHAGLSAALIGLAEATPNAYLFVAVLVLGNLIVLALEGLVVFVQTTRLVLFEFFLRFLRADGRLFRPLRRPPPGPRGRGA